MNTDLYDSANEHAVRATEIFYSIPEKLIALSTGALALSITFKSNYVPVAPKQIWLLPFSWCAFLATILLALIVIAGHGVQHVDYVNKSVEAIQSNQKPRVISCHARWYYRVANVLMKIAFLLGVIAFTWFAIENVTQQAAGG